MKTQFKLMHAGTDQQATLVTFDTAEEAWAYAYETIELNVFDGDQKDIWRIEKIMLELFEVEEFAD